MLLVLKSRIRPLDMSVDQALKYIISMGVAAPPNGTYGSYGPGTPIIVVSDNRN